jgi:CHAD domain-containing protein
VAKPRPIPDLIAEDSYGEAAAKIIAVRTDELSEHARGVLDTGDIERVHDMRVATRRLRAALEVFEPCFPRKPYRQTLREVKRLADGLGERRDRDVAIVVLNGFSEQMPAPDRRGVSSLTDRLRDEQAEANTALGPLVGSQNLGPLRESLLALVEAARESGRAGEEPAGAGS